MRQTGRDCPFDLWAACVPASDPHTHQHQHQKDPNMTHTLKTISSLLAAIVLTGCASSHVHLQVNTQPMGAYITETSGTVFGSSPAVIQYDRAALKLHRDKAGCSIVRGFHARWVSGATASTEPTIRLCGSHDNFNVMITRDTNAPGLAQDMEFALRMSTAGAAQRQADAAELGAGAQFLNLMKPGH